MRRAKTEILVKSVTHEDEIYRIMTLCSDAFYDPSFAEPRRIEKLAHKFAEHAMFLCAVQECEVCGFLAYYENDFASRIGYLSMITVRQGFQGCGIGSKLLDRAISDLKKGGFTMFRLEVRKDNTSALRFYVKKGFLREGEASENSDYYILNLSGESVSSRILQQSDP